MFIEFVARHQRISILVLFLSLFYAVFATKPEFMFTKKGTFRDFGIGYLKKTIIPPWLFTIFIAVLAYLVVKFVCIYPNLV